jgi:hypothetical protein
LTRYSLPIFVTGNKIIREGDYLDTATIIAELEAERDRLNSAIAALSGRPTRTLTLSGKPDGRRRKRILSAAARKKIGEAMRKRWAERKEKAA